MFLAASFVLAKNGHHQMVNTQIRLIIFFAKRMELYTVSKNKTRSC